MDRGRNPGNAEILEVVQSRFGFVILPWRSGTVQRAVEICGHDRVRRGRHPVNMPDPALRFPYRSLNRAIVRAERMERSNARSCATSAPTIGFGRHRTKDVRYAVAGQDLRWYLFGIRPQRPRSRPRSLTSK